MTDQKITIDALTEESVSIKTQQYLLLDGVAYAAGPACRCAYVNSDRGRAEITAALAEPYLAAVMMVWGDTATVPDEAEVEL